MGLLAKLFERCVPKVAVVGDVAVLDFDLHGWLHPNCVLRLQRPRQHRLRYDERIEQPPKLHSNLAREVCPGFADIDELLALPAREMERAHGAGMRQEADDVKRCHALST